MPTSRSVLITRAVMALALLATSSASCSAAPPNDEGSSTTSEALTPSASTCPASVTYGVIKFVAPGADVDCPSVASAYGTWVSSTGYPAEACTPTRDPERGVPVFCTYEWKPSRSHPHAPPDEVALELLPHVYEAPFGSGGDTSCEGPSSLPHAALLDRAGVVCPLGPHRHDGAAACTVCGALQYPGIGHGVVFLPRTSTLRTIVVGLSNGTQRIVTFDTNERTTTLALSLANRSPYIEVPLPLLPSGVRYVEGPAPGYGYGHPRP